MPGGFLNNYFGFSKQQRNGLFVLILLSLLLLLIRVTYPAFITPDTIVLLDLPLIEKKLDSSYSTTAHASEYKQRREPSQPSHLFVFDPNLVSYEQLLQLGLKEKTAQIFIKFRKKGFVFKEKKDLQKVYGISDHLYAKLEPYILIGKKDHPKQETEASPEIKTPEKPRGSSQSQIIRVELNSADSAQLVALNGIGSGFARRILKYKSALGGFVKAEQLKEVYGFNEEMYEKIKNVVYVEAIGLRKINLNTDDFKTLNKHPYLTYELTKTIFDWRRKTTINAENLKDILNDPNLYQKLLPYLTFE